MLFPLLKINLFTLTAFYSILPTIVGFTVYKKLKLYFKVLVFNLLLGNVLMLLSNIDTLTGLINTHYLFYLSILISGIYFPLIFVFLIKKHQKALISFSIFILVFMIYDFFKTGLKEMNVLPYIFIDLFNMVMCIWAFKILKKMHFSVRLFLCVQLTYALYDVMVNFSSSYFYNYLNEYFFNLIWYTFNPIVGFIYYSFLAYIFYLASKEFMPRFEDYPDFN